MLQTTFALMLTGLLMTAAATPSPVRAEADLKQAYKREFAFLEAEKNVLKKRLEELSRERESKVSAAKAEVDALQGNIMRASLEAERLNEMLYDAERSVESVEEGGELVERTLDQVAAELEKAEIALPERPGEDEAAIAAQLQSSLDLALDELGKAGSVRTENGAFFDASGGRVEGQIVRLGGIASYGVADSAAGVLAPAGADRMRLWPEGQTAAVARAVAQGQVPSVLPVFVYESLEKGIEPKKDKTPLEIIRSGGTIAWVIVGMGLLALMMVVLRGLLLMRAASNTEKLVQQLTPLLDQSEIDAAVDLCRKAKSAAGRVLRVTLQNLHTEREHLEDIISESILHETPHIDRFGSAIMVLAAVAPLMGLLGTVTGMISTFDVITEFGTGNPKLLSGGISEALVTTELGLIVAIPALLCGNLLSGWADAIKDDMDKSALRVTNIANGIRVSRMLADVQRPKPSVTSTPAEAV